MTNEADATAAELKRRDFLRLAGLGAGGLLTASALPDVAAAAPLDAGTAVAPARARARASSRVVVVGAGIWGASTALELARRGAQVTLLDQYGPGNSRSTSGDETRGIRSSYGDRAESSALWTRWAREAITRWTAFDAEHGRRFDTRFFIRTGDVILRPREEPFTTRTTETWDQLRVPYERVTPDEAQRRWPMIKSDEYPVILYEPDAGVARARAAVHATVALARDAGVTLRIGRVRPGEVRSGTMQGVTLDDGSVLDADAFVFACGPWLGKVFPEQLGQRMRTPLGFVCYFGTPAGDHRFAAPTMPSWNVPGVTGWGALPVDSRGFRIRGAFAPPAPPRREDEPDAPPPPRPVPDPRAQDADLSSRWSSEERIAGSRRVLERVFPAMADAPLLETRSCHYESSTNRNFIVDRLPGATNAWVMGAGQAEGFKFAPLLGEYGAARVLGERTDEALDSAFAFPTTSYELTRPGADDE